MECLFGLQCSDTSCPLAHPTGWQSAAVPSKRPRSNRRGAGRKRREERLAPDATGSGRTDKGGIDASVAAMAGDDERGGAPEQAASTLTVGDPEGLYARLGVPTSATADEIRAAYKRAALRTHPDKGGNATEFQLAAAAYAVLSDPDLRAGYDATGRSSGQPADAMWVFTTFARQFAREDYAEVFGEGVSDAAAAHMEASGMTPAFLAQMQAEILAESSRQGPAGAVAPRTEEALSGSDPARGVAATAARPSKAGGALATGFVHEPRSGLWRKETEVAVELCSKRVRERVWFEGWTAEAAGEWEWYEGWVKLGVPLEASDGAKKAFEPRSRKGRGKGRKERLTRALRSALPLPSSLLLEAL